MRPPGSEIILKGQLGLSKTEVCKSDLPVRVGDIVERVGQVLQLVRFFEQFHLL